MANSEVLLNKIPKHIGEKMKKDYYNLAHEWHVDTKETIRLERNRLYVLTVFFALAVAALAIGISVLLPLKEVEHYLFENNTVTGEIKQIKAMKAGEFNVQQANITKYVADYLEFREAYYPDDIQKNSKNVLLMSSDQVGQEYVTYMTNDKKSPYNRLEKGEHINIYITSISHVKPNKSVLVHMESKEYKLGKPKPVFKRWRIVMDFIWTGIPPDNKYIYFNPAGFKTTRYIKNQEISTEVDGL